MANTRRPKLKTLGLLIAVCCSPIFCTAQLTDDFSDRNLNTDPQWLGNLNDFIVNNDLQLQLNAESSGISWISTPLQFPSFCEWQFWIKLGFSPSKNNNCQVYLMSDQQDLNSENLNAVFLQLGESGSKDAIELFHQKGNEINSICRGTDAFISSSFELKIKVIRTEENEWKIEISPSGNSIFQLEASGTAEVFFDEGYFGFQCKYTSSNRTKFYVDDLYVGQPIIDTEAPELVSLEVIQANQIELTFSEALNPETLYKLQNYRIEPEIGNPDSITVDESSKMINLFFDRPFTENIPYALSIENLSDYSGNRINPVLSDFIYYVLRTNDLVINEVLFDPLGGGEEYIEIYNRSDKVLNLGKLKLGRIKNDFPHPPDTSFCKFSDTSQFIYPEQYWIISPSADKIPDYYSVENPDHMVSVKNMPALLNDKGHLFLVSDSGILINEMKYREDMHHPFLNFTDGVALEKIHFEAPSMDGNSWKSASESSGYGTPTYQNSQFVEATESEERINLNPAVFSPDQDGNDDVLSISLNLKEEGSTLNVFVYNSSGQQIKHLVKNKIAGIKEIFYWDGSDENNSIQTAGHYIILIEIFDLNGKKEHIKKTTVLARSLK